MKEVILDPDAGEIRLTLDSESVLRFARSESNEPWCGLKLTHDGPTSKLAGDRPDAVRQRNVS